MPRDIPVGNGNILVAFDKDYNLREFFFPHVGQEAHTGAQPFRLGLWIDGSFSWIPSGWQVKLDYLDNTLVTNVELNNPALKLRITVNDWVDLEENIYLKKFTLEDLSGRDRHVRLFLTHAFCILGNNIGDTAAYRPEAKALLHYKNDRYFLINIFANKKPGIDNFATGNTGDPGHEGTWKDAEDGILSSNPIAQGSVDSVVGIPLVVQANAKETCYYWICCGRDWDEVSGLNELVLKKRPEELLKRTSGYWKFWQEKEELNRDLLPEKILCLYQRSLLILRTQVDNGGAIIAANDSDVVYFNRDTYSYVWPRDGALASYALDLAGYREASQRFFNFCARIVEKDGYFLHKYTPSGTLASSWHPWEKDKRRQLPIQEDETALVVWALWNHFKIYKDVEFIKPLYKPLIVNCADFMMNYRDNGTGLPLPSYDLWEERQGVLTFTCAAVHGGLIAAANFAGVFGDAGLAEEYLAGARQLRAAMDKYLYLEKEQRFCRMINFNKDGEIEVDKTLDASLFGIFAFGAYGANEEKVSSTLAQMYDKLWCGGAAGGLARYENDAYYRKANDVTGNPWFVTTLWLAQYYIASARTRAELEKALAVLEWCCEHSLPSKVLAEQVDPRTSEPLSVSPLTWSHATYIAAVQEYLNKFLEIEKCDACKQPKHSKYARQSVYFK